VLTLVLDRVLFRHTFGAAKLIGVLIIVFGVALTSAPGFAGANIDPQGVMFVAFSAIGYALYIAAAYPLTKTVAPIASATFIYGSYALVFAIAAAINGFSIPPAEELWLNVLFIGTLGGALQILSFSYALPRLASSGYAVIVCLEVVTVVLAGVFLLGEKLQGIQWLGVALVIGGIFLARASRSMSRAVPLPTAPAEEKSAQ
jgi:drug/metabolite transporter (DMT)-like permease